MHGKRIKAHVKPKKTRPIYVHLILLAALAHQEMQRPAVPQLGRAQLRARGAPAQRLRQLTGAHEAHHELLYGRQVLLEMEEMSLRTDDM